MYRYGPRENRMRFQGMGAYNRMVSPPNQAYYNQPDYPHNVYPPPQQPVYFMGNQPGQFVTPCNNQQSSNPYWVQNAPYNNYSDSGFEQYENHNAGGTQNQVSLSYTYDPNMQRNGHNQSTYGQKWSGSGQRGFNKHKTAFNNSGVEFDNSRPQHFGRKPPESNYSQNHFRTRQKQPFHHDQPPPHNRGVQVGNYSQYPNSTQDSFNNGEAPQFSHTTQSSMGEYRPHQKQFANFTREPHQRGNAARRRAGHSVRYPAGSANARNNGACGDELTESLDMCSLSVDRAMEVDRAMDAMNDYVNASAKQAEEAHSYSARKKASDDSHLDQRGSLTKLLTSGTYECVICCSNVRCDVAVWSCSSCFHVFHLYCVKKWARSSVDAGNEGWRCPTCQNVCANVPSKYLCYCGKSANPEYSRTDTPHSCGNSCGKARAHDCPHRCNILCHPGPCPPCEATATHACVCARSKKSARCGTLNEFRCSQECGRALNCGRHPCIRVCHDGTCPPCRAVVVQKCHGGHEVREIVCGSVEATEETYQCGQSCTTALECGNHECGEPCHPGDCGSCRRLPSNIATCPCGQVRVDELPAPQRTSCLDPLATCDNLCAKPLICGLKGKEHRCVSTCHDGPCPTCSRNMEVQCACGALTESMPCTKALLYTSDNVFKCKMRCKKKKSCGRHKCTNVCCVDKEHLCMVKCGRRLPCGRHRCDLICHPSNCPPCLESSFDELRCECGVEVMYPPIPCGTRPPECSQPCTRRHTCDHQVLHNCHNDDNCPPCVALMSKTCMGGHEVRKNIPCHQADVSCGLPCDKDLKCTVHKCQRVCHKGACLAGKAVCTQACPVPRPVCGHPCAAPCHRTKPCPASVCSTKVTLKCRCGNRAANVKCLLGGAETAGNKFSATHVNMSVQGLQYGRDIDLKELHSVTKGSVRHLECDGSCALIERNKRVALALQIKNPDFSSKVGPPSYPAFLKDFTKDNQQFVASVEKQIAELVQKAHKSKQSSRSHSFPPMNMNQRRVIHELAPFYGCETQSYDSEPKKNVVITAFSKRSWLPSVTLTRAIQQGEHPRPPMPIPHVHRESELREANREARQSTDVVVESKRTTSKPSMDYFDMTPL